MGVRGFGSLSLRERDRVRVTVVQHAKRDAR